MLVCLNSALMDFERPVRDRAIQSLGVESLTPRSHEAVATEEECAGRTAGSGPALRWRLVLRHAIVDAPGGREGPGGWRGGRRRREVFGPQAVAHSPTRLGMRHGSMASFSIWVDCGL